MEDLLARHRAELKAMQAETQALKKTATKGGKKKKKEVQAQIEQMEKDLKERHQREIAGISTAPECGSEDVA